MKPRLLQFLHALILAAWHRCRTAPRQCMAQAWGVITAILTTDDPVNEKIITERLNTCARCPVFYGPMKTCGSPRSADPDLGCWCYMPVKARTRANCWLYDQRLPGGWHRSLNSATVEE